jgi:hypothetical protein
MPLRLRQVAELDYWHFRHPQLASRKQPRVAGDYVVVSTDQDRVGPAKLPHGCRNLRDLFGRVRARVGDPGNDRAG